MIRAASPCMRARREKYHEKKLGCHRMHEARTHTFAASTFAKQQFAHSRQLDNSSDKSRLESNFAWIELLAMFRDAMYRNVKYVIRIRFESAESRDVSGINQSVRASIRARSRMATVNRERRLFDGSSKLWIRCKIIGLRNDSERTKVTNERK